MPPYKQFTDTTTRVALWHLTESADLLAQQCALCGLDMYGISHPHVGTTTGEHRCCERLATQLLLYQLTGTANSLTHNQAGAPHLVDRPNDHVSITHTTDMVAVAIDPTVPIGIDVERRGRTQVLRVRHKFLNSQEQAMIAPDDLEAHLVAWTAKEALIKLVGNPAIDWTHDLRLSPFVPLPPAAADEGQPLTFTAASPRTTFALHTYLFDQHILTIAHRARHDDACL